MRNQLMLALSKCIADGTNATCTSDLRRAVMLSCSCSVVIANPYCQEVCDFILWLVRPYLAPPPLPPLSPRGLASSGRALQWRRAGAVRAVRAVGPRSARRPSAAGPRIPLSTPQFPWPPTFFSSALRASSLLALAVLVLPAAVVLGTRTAA